MRRRIDNRIVWSLAVVSVALSSPLSLWMAAEHGPTSDEPATIAALDAALFGPGCAGYRRIAGEEPCVGVHGLAMRIDPRTLCARAISTMTTGPCRADRPSPHDLDSLCRLQI